MNKGSNHLKLLDKHFLKTNKFNKIFNFNSVKVSNSFTENVPQSQQERP